MPETPLDEGTISMTTAEARPWDKNWGEEMLRPRPIEFESGLDMYRRAALADPDRPLLCYFDATITASDFDAQADAVAVWLQGRGIAPGDRIALYLQNVPEFVITIVAAWKVGAIPVPVNPMYREDELRELLTDSGARALVVLQHLWHDVASHVVDETAVEFVLSTNGLRYLASDGRLPEVLEDVAEQPVPVGADFSAVVEEHRGRRPETVEVDGDDIAFLCYTSGTTGPPKGAMVTHRGAVFSSQNFRDMRGLDADDVVFAVAPLFHITGLICTISLGFLVPMPMVLGYRFDAGESMALIEQYGVTFTVGATTVFIAFLAHPEFDTRDISSLTKIICGGAPIPPAVLERYESATGVYMYNGYGLTETTSPTFGTPSGRRSPVDPRSGALALGVPLPGTDCVLLDDDGVDVGFDEPGEIVVRGPHVVPGYWGKPDETANAIRDGWLYTGDIGVMDDDGWVYMVDRKKDVINAAGYKVWPLEVEKVLYEHPAVREAAVVGIPDAYRGETVKAVVSLAPGEQATPEELIEFARQRLAAFKYPRTVEIIDDLPKTVSGKILRRALRDSSQDGSA
jgi:long-chain acyl-CoA synthetase